MLQLLGILSAVLVSVSYVPYVRDILRKQVRPERASWIIWVVLAVIAFYSQVAEGAEWSLWFTGFDSIGALVVLILSWKYGVGGLRRRDWVGLAIAAAGLLIWHFTHQAVYALVIAIGIDAVGAALTVWKTFEDPHSETYPMWVMVSVASLLAALAVGKIDAALLAYPLYIFVANISVVLAIAIGRGRKARA